MTLLQYITVFCEQLRLIEQEPLSLQLQDVFDDLDSPLIKIIFVVGLYCAGNIWHWTVNVLDIVSVENLVEFICLTIRKIFLTISLATLQLYDGLKHTVLWPLLLFFFALEQRYYVGIRYFVYSYCSLQRCYKDLFSLSIPFWSVWC